VSPVEISLIAFACIFGGAMLGMFLRGFLPEHHLSADSRDVMKLGTGMIATMASLVLGLLIGSAKGTFDTISSGVRQSGSKIILLDRTLARYGPETGHARDILRQSVASAIEQLWPKGKGTIAVEKVGQAEGGLEDLIHELRQLRPQSDDQRRLQTRAVEIVGEIAEARWPLLERVGQGSFPMPLLVLLVCWLTIIFSCFGLIASRNRTVLVVLFVCALSAASSLFLILELDQPFGGLIKVSADPLRNALAHLGR